MSTPIPTENWSKPFMLQCHAAAVEHGFIWIQPISEADALSFKMRFYRVRRRSDKSMASFIPPEYHLVTVGAWEPGPSSEGRLPIVYSSRPDGKPLPSIIPATGDELPPMPMPAPAIAPLPLNIEALDPASIEIKPEEIGSLVESLRKRARERDQ